MSNTTLRLGSYVLSCGALLVALVMPGPTYARILLILCAAHIVEYPAYRRGGGND
jgi:hypothetical protein